MNLTPTANPDYLPLISFMIFSSELNARCARKISKIFVINCSLTKIVFKRIFQAWFALGDDFMIFQRWSLKRILCICSTKRREKEFCKHWRVNNWAAEPEVMRRIFYEFIIRSLAHVCKLCMRGVANMWFREYEPESTDGSEYNNWAKNLWF